MIVTIDGPAGSGKSTVARGLARRLGWSFLDTGAMYRAVTRLAMDRGADLQDGDALCGLIDESEFEWNVGEDGMEVFVNGRDVTRSIRDEKVTANVKYIAGNAEIRSRLVSLQRDFARRHGNIVTEGRDQGTVVFPEAEYKFFVTADAQERARRRAGDLRQAGVDVDVEALQREIEQRDESDKNRAVGPLRAAEDAKVVDTTDLSVDEVIETLAGWVR